MSAREEVSARLASLERWQPVTNAFSRVFAGEALAEAEKLDAGLDGDGALRGVPVAIKDLFDVAGHETTGCCAAYESNVAADDAELVRRLRRAGAIIVGKTNQHELAMGATNQISACGPAHNPWDPERITGGSSGGSAAAVVSGVVDLALGTDTGGSIRIPSSLCGCWGLKPTHGSLPLDGVMPLAPSLDCPGPMALDAAGLELLWCVLSGTTPERLAPQPVRRVGLLTGVFERRVHPDSREGVGALALALESLGAEVVPVGGEGVDDAAEVWVDVVCPEMVEAHRPLLEMRERLHPRTAGFFARGITLIEDMPELREAAIERAAEISTWFRDRLEGSDLLLAPCTPYAAPRADEHEIDVGGGDKVDVHMGGTSILTRPVSLSGLPALSVPAGRTRASGERPALPIAAQLIGPPGSEPTLLDVAKRLEGQDERFRPRRAELPR